jgi:hypothetical protein
MTWPATGQDDASAGRFRQSGLFLAARLPAGAEATRTVPAIIPAARSLQASGALRVLRASTGAVVWQTMLRFHEIAATVKPHHIIRRRAR